jgi:hypothetical protein
MGKLLTDNQLEAIQKTAMLGMQTTVSIFRPTADSGLDLTDNPYGSAPGTPQDITPMGGVLGWLYSTPTPVATIDAGQLITVNTYRLWVPVDTDIRPRDRVVIGANTYVVSDTTADQTWPALLSCSLRLAE